MNDKTLLEDLLGSIKGQCGLMLHGTIESSTPQVHEAFNNALFESLRIQNEIYTQMSQRGWYTEETVQPNKIQKVEQKFSTQNWQ